MPILTAQQAKDARAALNLSQRRLAIDADVPRPMLSLFEQQRALPKDDFLFKLREFFLAEGVKFDDLEDDAPADSPPARPVSIVNGVVVSPAAPRRDFRLLDGVAVPAAMPDEDADALLEQLADVEAEIDELQQRQVAFTSNTIFAEPNEESVAAQQRLRLLMARSFCLMRALQGRESIDACTEVLGQFEAGGDKGDQRTWLRQVFGDVFGFAHPDDDPDAPTERTDKNWAGLARTRRRENLLVAENDG